MLAIGGAVPALAASQQPSNASTSVMLAAREVSKIVLPETSIDGPALSSVRGTANSPSESVIAWTGTDAGHHLNVETSTDGLHFGHKLTLNETSPYRPDVVLLGVGGPVAIAWTGTDANHSLNVLYDVYGHPQKLTLWHERSIAGPALLQYPGMFLAWTGTDANHSLNTLPLHVTASGIVTGEKAILSQFSSNAGPNLEQDGTSHLALMWASRTLQLKAAFSPDGVHLFGTLIGATTEISAYAPDVYLQDVYYGGSHKWIGWTGTDAAHHLNLALTSDVSATKTILGETARGGPALDYNNGLQVAWTGTDSLHHVNIARFVYS
jgi:hypothetical protein